MYNLLVPLKRTERCSTLIRDGPMGEIRHINFDSLPANAISPWDFQLQNLYNSNICITPKTNLHNWLDYPKERTVSLKRCGSS
ncbi:hypothetical protein HBI56_150520 [Parastagonospora nodorum]|uniref:Uncharacterized protein n=1 Tax=Phaeosphaeria nodorum (strain SN15 / ATCC MYA-4574 / FGSC 10173) TaxID=321614 RepID=A0A7U2I8A7_PHANO|nr:hypothetical protein HBH56_184010 [Parastagonospora nodorum]QRD04098.1 hypothetical protein JI435_420700 [Parastagonospora nodorum SN15]KAH3925984.1 hypothetical protein HBH54_173160 [Parastagonospora nodorum]KAH3944827.1 hypothetical protein HBH53_151780 [Parastagonospora nodorum]KAH3995336.1 hypothetical protein HBI10_173720 [Parastagonospora nodorum]